MNKPIRLTPQKQQELMSRRQLSERLVEFGWLSSSPEDLGEDFIVHIYSEGRATGITFHVQEKSVTNLYKRRKGEYLVYPFKIKDLKHWEGFGLPVVLTVWDVKLREGRWVELSEALEQLNQKRPHWRTNRSKVSVYIPWHNTLDAAGLARLRHNIGKHLYPVISKGKELTMRMSLSFPETEIGQEASDALDRLLKYGDEAKFKGEVITKLEFSEWAKPWLDIEQDPEQREIVIGSRKGKTLAVDVNAIGNNGQVASIHNIELTNVKSGGEGMQLSNGDQASPIRFEFVFSSSKSCSASVEVRNWGANVETTREIIQFLQVIAAGGKLQLYSLTGVWHFLMKRCCVQSNSCKCLRALGTTH